MLKFEKELLIDLLPPEFDRSRNINKRTSIKGIARRGEEFLLLYIAKHGIYEFPGGGIENNESHTETLAREILEETGYGIISVGNCWLRIVETSIDQNDTDSIFEVNCYFYDCSVGQIQIGLSQEQYEKDAGTTPKWLSLDEAIETNSETIRNANDSIPSWIKRTQLVLKMARERY